MSNIKNQPLDTNKSAPKKQLSGSRHMVFGKMNYILTLVSLAVLVIGFALMTGRTDIFSSTKITVAPIVVILGFIIGLAAIFYREKNGENE
jgi:uncharacterized RDD family membrane protein YckC